LKNWSTIFVLSIYAVLPWLVYAEDSYHLANDAYKQGRFEEVLAHLDSLSPEDARRPASYNLRSLALAEMGRYAEALAANQRARGLDPNNPNYVYNAGLIYLSQDDFRSAEKVFQLGIQKFPRAPQLYQGLGDTLIKLNRFQEAEVVLRTASNIDPLNSAIFVLLSKLYSSLGDERQFGEAATKAIEYGPANYLACYYYGSWLIEFKSDLAQGADYISRSIKLQPRFSEGLKAWGHIQSRTAHWQGAACAYERALAADAHDLQLFYLLSIVYRKMGEDLKAKGALATYRKLMKSQQSASKELHDQSR
jgi:tetratricopeptide (TPR) repeat protein